MSRLPAQQRQPGEQLRELIGELNLLHVLLAIYAIPAILIGAGMIIVVVTLAVMDGGFRQFMLFTAIVGLVIGLPAAFTR